VFLTSSRFAVSLEKKSGIILLISIFSTGFIVSMYFIFPVILGSLRSRNKPFFAKYFSKPIKKRNITSSASAIKIGISFSNFNELI
jgi:hypothetical protein